MATPQLAAQGMMALYRESRRKGNFLSSFFRPIAGSTGSTATTLTWDIVRYTDKIAGTTDKNTGANINTVGKFTSKEIEPPMYNEAVAIDARDLNNRVPGQDPFSAANMAFTARFMAIANEAMVEMSSLIDRSVELQAAQILQTGLLVLPGARPFSADFKPKASHFPTAGIAWSNVATAVPIDDIESLANQIRTDSRKNVVRAIFGRTALREFLNTDQVKEAADIRRMELIDVDPQIRDRGAIPYGTLVANGYELEMWHYQEEYEPFVPAANVRFVDDDKVILLPKDPALVVASLQVPRIVGPDPRVSGLISPPTKSELGFDITPNVWTTAEGNVVYAGMAAQVVLVPQGIDEFGAITT